MQAYAMYKDGKKPSECFSILTMRFIITQTTLIIFTILVVISQFHFFKELFSDLVWLGILGILLNILVVLILFLAVMKPKVLINISKPFISLSSKFHLNKSKPQKSKEEKLESFWISVNNYSLKFKEMSNEKRIVFYMIIFGLIQSILYYAITYTVYRTFGNFGITFLQIITTQAFLMLIMTLFPTPGAGLGAEGGFLLLFNPIFKNGTINLSILFWRIYVFYIPIIIGALFFFLSIKRNINKNKM